MYCFANSAELNGFDISQMMKNVSFKTELYFHRIFFRIAAIWHEMATDMSIWALGTLCDGFSLPINYLANMYDFASASRTERFQLADKQCSYAT